jgi:hypothetical protein
VELLALIADDTSPKASSTIGCLSESVDLDGLKSAHPNWRYFHITYILVRSFHLGNTYHIIFHALSARFGGSPPLGDVVRWKAAMFRSNYFALSLTRTNLTNPVRLLLLAIVTNRYTDSAR